MLNLKQFLLIVGFAASVGIFYWLVVFFVDHPVDGYLRMPGVPAQGGP